MKNTARLTLGKMRLVRDRMLAQFPFHAHVVAAGRFVVEPVDTMAVTIRGGELHFLLDPAFVANRSLDELVAVLEHEVNHVTLGHLEVDRSAYPDRDARILAEEVTANEFVRGTLPGRPHLLPDYDLPPDESTDERYEKLAARRNSVPPDANSVQPPDSSVQAGTHSVRANEKVDPVRAILTTDNHTLWPSSDANEVSATIHDVLTRAAAATPAALIPAHVRRRLAPRPTSARTEHLNKVRLMVSHRLMALLDRYQRQTATFRRPSRRLPQLVGIVPRTERRPLRVLFIVDTSASMPADVLAQVSALIGRVASQHQVTVVEADAVVRKVYRYAKPITIMRGRGTTDLRPPLAPLFVKRLRPDVIVFATDGDGRAPLDPPLVPIVWVLTPGSTPPTPWGTILELEP